MSSAAVPETGPAMSESTGHDGTKTGTGTDGISSATGRSSLEGASQPSARALYRLSAAALVVTGVSLALGEVLHPSPPFADSIATTQWAAAHVLWWVGGLGAMLGFSGLYLRHRDAVGLLGFVGSGSVVVGSALIACAMYFEAFVAPTIAARAPSLFETYPAGGGWGGFLAGVLAAGALIGAGLIMFAIAARRADILSRWAIALTVLGGVPFSVNFLLPHAVAVLAAVTFGVGLAGLASELWRQGDRPTAGTSTRA